MAKQTIYKQINRSITQNINVMIIPLKRNNMVAQYCVKFIQSEHNAKQAKTVQLKYFEERKKKSGVTKKISEISRTCIWKFNNST